MEKAAIPNGNGGENKGEDRGPGESELHRGPRVFFLGSSGGGHVQVRRMVKKH